VPRHSRVVKELPDELLWEVTDLDQAVKKARKCDIPELDKYGIISARGLLDLADWMVRSWFPTETTQGRDIYYILYVFYFVLLQEEMRSRQIRIVPKNINKSLKPPSQWVVDIAKDIGENEDEERLIDEATITSFRNSSLFHVLESEKSAPNWETFNHFIYRELNRPRDIDCPKDDRVITSLADSTFAGASQINDESEVVLRNIPWKAKDRLSPYGDMEVLSDSSLSLYAWMIIALLIPLVAGDIYTGTAARNGYDRQTCLADCEKFTDSCLQGVNDIHTNCAETCGKIPCDYRNDGCTNEEHNNCMVGCQNLPAIDCQLGHDICAKQCEYLQSCHEVCRAQSALQCITRCVVCTINDYVTPLVCVALTEAAAEICEAAADTLSAGCTNCEDVCTNQLETSCSEQCSTGDFIDRGSMSIGDNQCEPVAYSGRSCDKYMPIITTALCSWRQYRGQLNNQTFARLQQVLEACVTSEDPNKYKQVSKCNRKGNMEDGSLLIL
jgi:hypothetical protein